MVTNHASSWCTDTKDVTFQKGVDKVLGKNSHFIQAEISSMVCTIYAEKLIIGMLSLFMINNTEVGLCILIQEQQWSSLHMSIIFQRDEESEKFSYIKTI